MHPLKKAFRRARLHGARLLHSSAPLDPHRIAQPIVVAALGGSGTRVLGQLLLESGVYLGRRVDPGTLDSIDLRPFFNAHLAPLFDEPELDPPAACRDFNRWIRAHLRRIPGEQDDWGFKNPRSLWVLPFLSRRFPGMRLIHVVRDGRDMARSSNRFLLDTHGRALLGERWSGRAVRDQFELWALGNARAADAFDQHFGSRAIRVRYEDLCADPTIVIERLLDFLKRPMPRASIERLAASIEPSPGIGRGLTTDDEDLKAAARRHAAVLARFGYSAEP